MPSASIIEASDAEMRKAQSLPPLPDSVVICGFDAMPVIIGILASWMIFMVARCAELQCEPSIATTLASTSLLAALTASEGLHLLSMTRVSSLRPSTPPAALISSIARLTPHSSHSAATAAGPVCAVDTPITIGCAIAGAAPSTPATAPAVTQDFVPIAVSLACSQYRYIVSMVERSQDL